VFVTTLSARSLNDDKPVALGQSENGENDTDGTNTEGEDGRADLETSSRATSATTGGVRRSGSTRGLGAGGADGTRAGGGGRDDAGGGGKSGVDGGRGVANTVGRSGDLGCVGHGGDNAQRLGRLGVGLDLTGGIGVNSRVVLVITSAGLEGTVLGFVGRVEGASDTVVDVFTEAGSIGAGRVASLETESVTTHEVVPLDDLLVSGLVARPRGGVEKTTKGVTTEISAVGVEFSSVVVGTEVDEPLVDETDDLNVVGGLHELDTLEGTSGDETRSMTGLGAPGDFFVFRLADGGGTIRRCPQAEI